MGGAAVPIKACGASYRKEQERLFGVAILYAGTFGRKTLSPVTNNHYYIPCAKKRMFITVILA